MKIGQPAARRALWLGFAAVALIALILAGRPVAAIGPADVAITKSGPDVAAANSDFAYTITVTNGGPNDATTVSWSDTLPGNTTFVSLVAPVGWSATTPAVGSGGTATASIATLSNGAQAQFTLIVHVPAGTQSGTQYSNIATVTDDNDSNPANNTTATVTTTVQSAFLAITKTVPGIVDPASDVQFTITVTNNGPATAINASWSDRLPDSFPSGFAMTFVSLTQGSGPVFTLTDPNVGNNNTASGNIATLPNGATATFTLTLHVPPGTPSGTTYSNEAFVFADNDPDTENNEGFAFTTVGAPAPLADVAITKSGPQFAAPNSDVAYTITVNNYGPNDATNVSWTDTLPDGFPGGGTPMTFVSVNQTSGPTFNVTGGTTMTGTIATFPSGTTATFQITAHIPPGTDGRTYSNIANVTSDHDPNDENNESPAVTTVQVADIGVVKSGPATVIAGQNITYTITIANGGPDAASSATWTDTLPSGTTFVSLVQNSGPTFSLSKPAVGSGGTVSATTAVFANGASAQFTLVAQVAPITVNSTTLTNTAHASAQAYDSNPSNNDSPASTTVTRPTAAVTAIDRADASPTNADTVHWTVTFSTALSGLTGANFQLTNTGLGGTSAITQVTPVGTAPSATWTVTASIGTGSGTLELDLVNDTNLDHALSNLPFHGAAYTIDRIPAAITAVGGTPQLALAGSPFAAPLQAKVVNAENQPLAGVVVTFTVNPAGSAGATLSGATATTGADGVASTNATANGAAGSYTVTANVTPPLGTAATFSLTNTQGTLVSIAVSYTGGSRPNKVGDRLTFTATGTYQDGSTRDITSQVTWSSSNAAVVMLDKDTPNTGTATGPGTATVTATLNGVTGTAAVTVQGGTSVGVAPAPAPASRPVGPAGGAPGTTPPAPAPIPTGR